MSVSTPRPSGSTAHRPEYVGVGGLRQHGLEQVLRGLHGHDALDALGDAAAWPIQGLITHFRHEIEERIDQYSHKADLDDQGVRDPVHMVAAE